MSSASSSSAPLNVNDRALCFHGPVMYEAKVLKTAVWDESSTELGSVGAHYFVHYKGWKQTWDEWVPQSRIFPYNDETLVKQKAINAAITDSDKRSKANASHAIKSGGSHALGNNTATGSSRRDGRAVEGSRKRRRDDDDGGIKKPDLKLVIPDALKVIMVDDWENITKNNRLVPLPRTPNVIEILSQFKAHVLTTSLPETPALTQTLLTGLQTYFDRSLGSSLLYRFERAQYAEIRKKYVTGPDVKLGEEKEMSSVYGGEHLCRLIVNLPSMVKHTTMDDTSVALLKDYVTELMGWMVQEKNRLFVREYEHPGTHYQNIARP